MKKFNQITLLIVAIAATNVSYAQFGSLKDVKVSNKGEKTTVKTKNVDLEFGKDKSTDQNKDSGSADDQNSNSSSTPKTYKSNPVFTPKGNSSSNSNSSNSSSNSNSSSSSSSSSNSSDKDAIKALMAEEEQLGSKLKQNQFTLDKIMRFENNEVVETFMSTYKTFDDYMNGAEMQRAIEISQKKDDSKTGYSVSRDIKYHNKSVKDYAEKFNAPSKGVDDTPENLINEKIKSATSSQDNFEKVKFLDEALFIGQCALFFAPDNAGYKSAIAKATAIKAQIVSKQGATADKFTQGDAIHKKYLNKAICSYKPFPASAAQINEADIVTSITSASQALYCAIPLSNTFKQLRSVDDPFFKMAIAIDEKAKENNDNYKIYMTGKEQASYLTFNLIPTKSYIDNLKFNPDNKEQEEELSNIRGIVSSLSRNVFAGVDHTIDFVFKIIDDQQPKGGAPGGRGHRFISTTLKINVKQEDIAMWGEIEKAIDKKFLASVHMKPVTLNNPSFIKGLKERFVTGWAQFEFVSARIVGKNYTLDNRWENNVFKKGKIIDMQVVGKGSEGKHYLIDIEAGRNESSPGVYEGEFYVRLTNWETEILPENVAK